MSMATIATHIEGRFKLAVDIGVGTGTVEGHIRRLRYRHLRYDARQSCLSGRAWVLRCVWKSMVGGCRLQMLGEVEIIRV